MIPPHGLRGPRFNPFDESEKVMVEFFFLVEKMW